MLSVYLLIDPGDRGEGWRVDLHQRLARIAWAIGDGDEERQKAFEATANRVERRFDGPELPSGRLQVGFCAVSDGREQRETWFGIQIAATATEIVHTPRPHLTPLVELLKEGAPVGVLS